ncbi:hypothetical protein THOA03_400010 [Vibrio owensii]|nr:hypothetical protein THOA03_400010 [Vibrio owensii]
MQGLHILLGAAHCEKQCAIHKLLQKFSVQGSKSNSYAKIKIMLLIKSLNIN